MSLHESDAAAAAVAVAPRVSLADINRAIAHEFYVTGDEAVNTSDQEAVGKLRILTLCFLITSNGFTIVGKSAPAAPENFNRELGQRFAREDAVRQLWPLMGFALRDRLQGGDARTSPDYPRAKQGNVGA